jgi:hypothetical protein
MSVRAEQMRWTTYGRPIRDNRIPQELQQKTCPVPMSCGRWMPGSLDLPATEGGVQEVGMEETSILVTRRTSSKVV